VACTRMTACPRGSGARETASSDLSEPKQMLEAQVRELCVRGGINAQYEGARGRGRAEARPGEGRQNDRWTPCDAPSRPGLAQEMATAQAIRTMPPAAELRPGRAPPCQSAAMLNGRCRMHGGKSTGPRTAEGIERIRTSRTKHGRYSQAAIVKRRQSRQLIETIRALISGDTDSMDEG
jgi:hypothetical protein